MQKVNNFRVIRSRMMSSHTGYYKFRAGDLLDNGRYRVVQNSGRGVFSSVVRVEDLHVENRQLVVKMIRNNDTLRKAGLQGWNGG